MVKRHRLAAGMTQEQLAHRSGVSLATVRSVEAGRVKKPYRLRDIYRALGIASEEPAAALTDAELIAELERRHPGRIAGRSARSAEPETPAEIIAWYRANIRDLPPPPESPEEILTWFRRMFPKGIDAGQPPDPDPNRRTANTADMPGQDDDPGDVASPGA